MLFILSYLAILSYLILSYLNIQASILNDMQNDMNALKHRADSSFVNFEKEVVIDLQETGAIAKLAIDDTIQRLYKSSQVNDTYLGNVKRCHIIRTITLICHAHRTLHCTVDRMKIRFIQKLSC